MLKNGTFIEDGDDFYEDTPDPVDTEATITVLSENGEPVSYDFGNRPEGDYPEGKISGHKFKDNNRNSLWDTGEPALSNWTIKLYSGEEQIDETTTNASGYYEFTNLEFGDYRVEEVQQTGWTQTAPDTEENPGYFDVTLDEAYRLVGDLDFGNYRPSGGGDDYGSISGHKYNDLNGNGEWDKDGDKPEPALSGWTINLSNGDTDITDEDGYYSFTRLPYGTYTVSEVQQEGWTQTAPESFDFTVVINRSNEDHKDLDFGNEEDSEIIIPPTAGPEPTPIVPLVVEVTPKRVPAGDPTITVTPGADTVQVYALLPDGRRLELKQDKNGDWKVSFYVAFETADGPYPIEVYAVDKFGAARQSIYTITIDNSLPVMKMQKAAQADGSYVLEIKPLFNAVAIDYSVGDKTLKLSRTQKGWWSAVVPAGDGIIKVIDESGYVVNQSLSLPVIPIALQSKVAGSDAWETIAAVKSAVVNPESAGTEAGTINYSLYLWAAAVVALILAAAAAVQGILRSKVK
nr:SdrD B-like domain-containing protein [Phosphitispora fastidiosa]